MNFHDLQAQAQSRHLTILGGFHPVAGDKTPKDCKTLLLLGPHEPAFWGAFKEAPEWHGGHADPMDRWSLRVIGKWAMQLDAQALFPFGGPPYQPFFTWALRTGRIHASPILLLVHDEAGLFVSFRGALALRARIDLPPAPENPCTSCGTQPCLTSCPVDALSGEGYKVDTCKAYLDTQDGKECMQQGCRARRACPVSGNHPRLPAQSAYHMRQFKE
ncbi:MAG: ferredoxin [Pseudomonadota bacterium]